MVALPELLGTAGFWRRSESGKQEEDLTGPSGPRHILGISLYVHLGVVGDFENFEHTQELKSIMTPASVIIISWPILFYLFPLLSHTKLFEANT